jgi:hypothetical protein
MGEQEGSRRNCYTAERPQDFKFSFVSVGMDEMIPGKLGYVSLTQIPHTGP